MIDCEGATRGFSFDAACGHSTQLQGLTIRHGRAESGGAIHCDHGEPLIVRCRFVDNIATEFGGAVHSESSLARFDHCLMAGNRALKGGGAVYECCCSGVEFDQCTFVKNSAPEGSAVYCRGLSDARIYGSIVALNDGGAALTHREFSGHILAKVTDVFGNPGGDWAGLMVHDVEKDGNLSINPLFSDPESGDYSLRPESPCRLRIDGEARVLGAIP